MDSFITYHILDVFTENAFGGNPLAIFESEIDLSSAQMQRLARELNLSETVFILPVEGSDDKLMRIFTPSVELPTAGHPTIGTACFLKNTLNFKGKNPDGYSLRQNIGSIKVDLVANEIGEFDALMHQPLPSFQETFNDKGLIASLVGLRSEEILSDLPCQIVNCGNPFLIVPIDSLDSIQEISLNNTLYQQIIEEFGITGVMAFTTETNDSNHKTHSRMFAPHIGVAEDPATGSAHGPLACYLHQYEIINMENTDGIIGEQGYEIGRPSQVKMQIVTKNGAITEVLVGGRSVYMGHGKIRIPNA